MPEISPETISSMRPGARNPKMSPYANRNNIVIHSAEIFSLTPTLTSSNSRALVLATCPSPDERSRRRLVVLRRPAALLPEPHTRRCASHGEAQERRGVLQGPAGRASKGAPEAPRHDRDGRARGGRGDHLQHAGVPAQRKGFRRIH